MIGKIPFYLARWSYRRPKTVFALGIALTIILGLFATRLELHNDFVELLPPKLEQVKTIRYVLSETGGVSYQAVTTVSPSQKQNRKFLRDIRGKLNHYFWEPGWGAGRSLQEEYERTGQLLRGILRYAKHPTAYEKEQLDLRIENLDKVPMIDYAIAKYDRSFFTKRQLLFLKNKDLKTIYKRLKSYIGSETYKGIMIEPDEEKKKQAKKKKKGKLDFSDIEAKYKKQLSSLPKRIEVKQGDTYSNALMIRPRGASTDLIFTQMLIARLKTTIKEMKPKTYNKNMKVWLQGAYRNNLREFEGISADLQRSIFSTFVLLVLLVLVFFRRIRVLWLLPLPLVMGTIWTFGLTYLFIGYLTTVTGFIGALLFGLGIDYGVYFLDRYFQERREGKSIEESLDICYTWTGGAIATAALTTAVGFFALMVCRFRGFTQFGLIGGMGIVLCLFAMMTLLPALIAYSESRKALDPPQTGFKTSSLMGRRFPAALPLTFIGLVIVGISFYSVQHVPSEVNMKRLGFQNAGTLQDSKRWERFDKIFHQNGMVPVIFLTSQEDTARHLTKEVIRRGDAANKKNPNWKKKVVVQAFSPFDFIPTNQYDKIRTIGKISRLLESNEDEIKDDKKAQKFYDKYKPLLDVEEFGIGDLPAYLQRDLVLYNRNNFNQVKGYIVAVVSGMNLSNGDEARKLNSVLKQIPHKKKSYDPSGEPIIFAELMRVVGEDGVIAVVASLLAISLLVLIDLRNWRLTLLALWPLLTGLLGLTIALVVFDIRVNFFNMVVFPALLGIGVDAGVHMLHRYREKPSLGTLGVPVELMGPIAVASTTTVISFATMITAKHMGMRSVGVLAVVGLFTCLFCTFVLLPALMELIFKLFPLSAKESPEIAAAEENS
ncbi:MAG: hypothetical protein EP343_31365 [Deltaproteobacteria bacterium]|nr:MAG: hypothetical protein EP343_31365 [Deltaproteobacteria bacterium]